MIEFIAKYWIEVLFSIFVGGASILFKHYLKLLREEQKRDRDKFFEEIKKAFGKKDEELQQEITKIKTGVLSIQKPIFINKCRALLNSEHQITLEEYRDIGNEHDVYNSLGGNHEGDALFGLVDKKFEKGLDN